MIATPMTAQWAWYLICIVSPSPFNQEYIPDSRKVTLILAFLVLFLRFVPPLSLFHIRSHLLSAYVCPLATLGRTGCTSAASPCLVVRARVQMRLTAHDLMTDNFTDDASSLVLPCAAL
jgi:hypothetical protein